MESPPMAARKSSDLTVYSLIILVVLSIGLGAFYRLPRLDIRPMHTDEAILASKLSDYWTTGHFKYDPTDYHGPALHYVSAAWGKLAGWGMPDSWTDAQVRTIAALCGLGLILTTLLFKDALGRFGTGFAMLLTGVSPMMIFYSRYFIMEMLFVWLVALFLASLWRYARSGSPLWLILAGASLGFQHATKETFVINLAAALCGWLVARTLVGPFNAQTTSSSLSLGSSRKKSGVSNAWIWVAIPAVAVSVASFSGGFHDWQAVQDSITTYASYWQRSGGSGHEKPFFYYITLIFGHRETVIWTEALIGGLGIVGMLHSVFGDHRDTGRQSFQVFLSIYTLALFTVYSILPYKTPWSILAAQHGLILLAGFGSAAIWGVVRGGFLGILYRFGLAAGIYHLCAQAALVTSMNPRQDYSADSRNPYVYSHTTPSLLRLVERVRQLHALDRSLTGQVISQDAGWPLPWYWRTIPQIGYQQTLPADLNASIIVCDSNLQEAVKARLTRPYREDGPYGMRPKLTLQVFIEESLWNKLTSPAASPEAKAP